MRLNAIVLLGLVVVLMGVVNPEAKAWDPRCDDPRHAGRAECQEPPTTTTTTTTTSGSTTTSQAPNTTTTEGTGLLDAIAALGCSNTKDAVSDKGGYLDQSDEDNLIVVAAGGHTVSGWATNHRGSWDSRYLGFRPVDGYDGVWFHLCERASSGLDEADVLTVLENIWDTDPGIPVWLSPMNTYDGVYCPVTDGNLIAEQGAEIADNLAASMDNVFRGPDTGPLTSGMVRRDDCHPNSAGVALLGSQLVEWFDE